MIQTICLAAVNAKYIHSNPAVYSLRAYAGEKYAENIIIAEYTINHRREQILAGLYKKRPDVLAFSCYIWNWEMITELLPDIHTVLPDVPIWLGGPEVSYDAPRIMEQFPFLTGIMIGEGEETFCELVKYYIEDKGCLSGIDGIYTKETGYTGSRNIMDLNAIPFFYKDLEEFANRIMYYETSRGCPFRCSYCLSSIDKKVRLRDFSLVERELRFFIDHRVKQVKLIDRTFNCNHTHAKNIWRYISEHDNGVTNFHFEVSADLLDEEELEILRGMRTGLVQLEIGVQSTNPKTIEAIHRTMNLDRLKRVVSTIHDGKNIHMHLDLIAGLPYENLDSFIHSFNDVYAMRPHQLQMGFLKVLKGSSMEEEAETYGICYSHRPPYEVLSTKWITYDDVLKLKKIEEMVELYYNSAQFRHVLPLLETFFANPFGMYEALADFYEEKGYAIASPSRAYRYDILLEFGLIFDEKDVSGKPVHEDLLRELLTFDSYLREKCKSRPSFAKDLSPYRQQIKELKAEKTTHTEVFDYPVWEEDSITAWKKSKTPCYVVFTYDKDKRNPLTGDARVAYYRAD